MAGYIDMQKNLCIIQVRAEPKIFGSALCNYQHILYQFCDFTQNLKEFCANSQNLKQSLIISLISPTSAH